MKCFLHQWFPPLAFALCWGMLPELAWAEPPKASSGVIAKLFGRKKAPKILDFPMENPKSFRKSEGERDIDVIVIHHISAIHWESASFQLPFRTRIARFVNQLEDPSVARDRSRYEFDPLFCKQILECYGFSAHYLIDRTGTVYRLVEEKDIAYHAGRSVMPGSNSKSDINGRSLGIELISAHPDQHEGIRNRSVPAYTEEQYRALRGLLVDLVKAYRVAPDKVLGHEEIAGQRAVELGIRTSANMRTDPGPLFDWKKVKGWLR